ncbi:uncharacterized protein JCM10292_005509 [Rhodotorula paludigena]|uniref:uncharacterized protein n=1 Tax=Rhodotorula paludigena TaxID=86838 RepID=UPI00317384CC
MERPSKRLKTVDNRTLASSSSLSSAPKATSRASQGSEALESALILTLLKDPQACKMLLDTLDQTAGKADPMFTAAYNSNPIGTTGIRKACRACLTSFLAPALCSGSSSPAGSVNLGTALSGHWLNHNTLKRMWTAVQLPSVFRPRFDTFCSRISAAIKQQERALREHIISGQNVLTFRPCADYAINEFDFNSVVDLLLQDVHFKLFVNKVVTALHKTFYLAVDLKNLTLYCVKGPKEVTAQLKDVKDDLPYL